MEENFETSENFEHEETEETIERFEKFENFENFESFEKLEKTNETANDNTDEEFDYDGWRMHRYDGYEGKLTEEIIVCKFEAYIRKLAGQSQGGGAEYDDLVQAGMEAAVKAFRGHENDAGLLRYLQIKIAGGIKDEAERQRRQARYSGAELDETDETAGTAVKETAGEYGLDDWNAREKAMFEKISSRLTKEEMIEVRLLYEGTSKRRTAAILGISHTAAGKRAEKIRRKLEPLKPWLQDMTEYKCTGDSMPFAKIKTENTNCERSKKQ
ncbi:MAG: hypothetical protein Q4E34_04965 [Synergistaceae bacterium]|nr:hypothetical protein [Synergistaceae bacterium]